MEKTERTVATTEEDGTNGGNDEDGRNGEDEEMKKTERKK